jgi:hypothetical protein
MLNYLKWLEFLKWVLYLTLLYSAAIAIVVVYLRHQKEPPANLTREDEESQYVAGFIFLYLMFVGFVFLFTFFGDWLSWIPAPGPINPNPIHPINR